MSDRVLLLFVIPLLWLADKIAGRAAERYWDAYERGQQDVVRGLAGEEQRGESEGV